MRPKRYWRHHIPNTDWSIKVWGENHIPNTTKGMEKDVGRGLKKPKTLSRAILVLNFRSIIYDASVL